MPYAVHDGVRIHYRVEGSGAPLILNHWSLGTLQGWYDCGYVDLLRSWFSVISVDVRGHGKSDKPHESEAYALERRVGDLVAVLDDAGVGRALFYGYSMGGWIGYGLAKHAPSRFRAVAVGGAHPYAQDMSGLRSLLAIGVSSGAGAFAGKMRNGDEEFTRIHEAQWRTADFEAQLLAAQDRASLAEVLPTISAPWLVLCGSEDPVHEEARHASTEIPGARFESLLGLDHGAALCRSDLVVPVLRTFFDGIGGDGW